MSPYCTLLTVSSPNEFKGKNVVVVGLSNTGADATVELSKVAAKVYISHRGGARIVRSFPRVSQFECLL